MTAMLPRRSSVPPEENLFGPVARLSTLATELAEMPLGPRPAFRAELRSRLLGEAERTGQDQVPVSVSVSVPARSEVPVRTEVSARAELPSRQRARHGYRTAVVGLALALAGGGVAAAAERSLPGEPLYPVKRFGQSVRLALDPSSGVNPSLRLVSARISDAERTAALDPSGRDTSRWRAVGSALSDADSRLVQVSASAPAQELSAALAPDQVRLERLLPVVPVAYQSVVQQLRDTIDGLTAGHPVGGTVALPLDLLAPDRLSPAGALAAGWPLDPSTLALPPRPAAPHPLPIPIPQNQMSARRAAGSSSTTAPSRSGSRSTRAHGTGSNAASSAGPGSSAGTGFSAGPGSSAGTGSSGHLPRLPLGHRPGGGTGSGTSLGSVLPRTTSEVDNAVDRTVRGTLGSTRSDGTSSGGDLAGTVDRLVGGAVGDATDTVRRLP